MSSLLLIIISTALINNVVLSQFLGICSFLGVAGQPAVKRGGMLGSVKRGNRLVQCAVETCSGG